MELQHAPLTPEVLQTRERTLTPFFIISTFRLAFESFKEFGGGSLIAPKWDMEFHVHTNVSNLVVEAMLVQNPTKKCDQPIAYTFRLLNNAKKNYTTTKRETLATVYALHKFRHYLLGNKFFFYVDHMALLYLIKKLQLLD
jgi:hypothetical protein